ncbi:DUF4190 domain-containing protein [Novipirellula artificiosorum]|uniref:WD domain, G-beta repeat n=1 Tax=Novipirellula artificiosorum TaxID=2528016 RepID=A0A5C6D4A2_9BACT|nr:DUF4190 domain-containing protein [Novipirellula artificiosorum]TWU31588.1 WD domain, G-beta repeat [Novipirellula artificiosorum]
MNPYDDPLGAASENVRVAAQSSPNQPPVSSGLALTSMITALVSPVFLCLCGLSILPSLVAVVTGHFALSKIKASAGRMEGRGQALTGLIVGYPMLVLSIVVLFYMGGSFVDGWRRADRDRGAGNAFPSTFSTDEQRLREAELQVMSASGGDGATGNSPAAKKLALAYSEKFELMREALFTADRKRILSLSQGQFVVHCELHPDRCAFIVHVPTYRKFDDEAKDALAEIGWTIACGEAAKELQPGDSLAVGLRGTLLYGAIMTGKVPGSGREERFTIVEREALFAFFPASPRSPLDAKRDVDVMPNPTQQPGSFPTPILPSTMPPMPEIGNRPDLELGPAPLTPPGFPPMPELATPDLADLMPSPRPLPTPRAPSTGSSRSTPSKPKPVAESTDMAVDGIEIEPLCQFEDLGWTVKCLAFSPQGRFLAAGKLDRSILMFDLQNQTQLGDAKQVSEGQVESVAFSPDGKMLFAATSSGEAQMHTVDESGQVGDAKLLYRYARSADWVLPSPAAKFVLSGGDRGTLVWQTYGDSAGAERSLKASDRNLLAASLPTTGVEAMATDGRSLVFFDLRTAKQTKTISLDRGGTQAAAFSDDAKWLAVSSGREITIFDTATGQPRNSLAKETKETQWAVRFHPNGRWLISGGRGKAYLWDITTSEHLATIDLGNVLYIQSLAFSDDGRVLAAIPNAAGQTLRVFRIGGSRR